MIRSLGPSEAGGNRMRTRIGIVLTVVALAVGYLKNVTAQRYPSRKQRGGY